MFTDGAIDGVVVRQLKKHADARGALTELFRLDELPAGFLPAMAYISLTLSGVVRGPHEHKDQTDYFCFAGPSDFKVCLWDNRKASPTYLSRMVFIAGESSPAAVIVPNGVVHAYKNTGDKDGLVINCPNRLFKGHGGKGPVDEVRYENIADSPYRIE